MPVLQAVQVNHPFFFPILISFRYWAMFYYFTGEQRAIKNPGKPGFSVEASA